MKKLLLLMILLSILVPMVLGAGLGISPSRYVLEDALKGQDYQRSMRITSMSSEDSIFLINKSGNAADWIHFYDVDLATEIDKVEVAADAFSQFIAVYKIPEDAANGEYTAKIHARSIPKENLDQTGSAVSLVTTAIVRITVTGDQNLDADVRSISTKDVESGQPLRIKVDMQNTGNVKATPRIAVTINQNGEAIDSFEYQEHTIAVKDTEVIEAEWNTEGRGVGDFTAEVKVYLDQNLISERTLEFKILERGTFSAEGGIGKVEDPKITSTGKLYKMEVEFYNRGNIDVKAKLQGEVYRNDELIDNFEGDEVLVNVGSREVLSAYYKPEQNGNYVIKRNVVFEGKKLPVEELEFDLGGKRPGSKSASQPIIVLGIVAVVILLILVILLLIAAIRKK